jgi:hypothetical protein
MRHAVAKPQCFDRISNRPRIVFRKSSPASMGGFGDPELANLGLVWRSLGETKGTYKKADKTGTNQLGCFVKCYHQRLPPSSEVHWRVLI